MTIIRRIGAVALAAPLAMSIPVLGALPADAATTAVISPANGAVITSGTSITVKAHYDFALKMQLRVDGPGIGDTFLKESSWAGDLSAPLELRRNGKYKAYLKGSITGQTYDSNTFTVRIAPAAPTGVSASVSGSRLVVKWNRGYEDDLLGYSLSGSGVRSKSGSLASLCSGTSCSASLSMTRSSGAVSVAVKARRSTGTGGSLYSSAATASAVAGGGTGGLATGAVPSLPSGTTGPSTATPLTPFNNESPVTLPSVQPDGATPGLTYPAPQIATDAPKAVNVAATDRLQWGKSVGIALILLIVAAHLGTWTRRLRVHQAGANSLGTAARIARGGTGRKRVKSARERIARAEAIAKTGSVKTAAKGARAGDTMVLAAPKTASKAKPKSRPGRRPATMGKTGGVDVQIAKPANGRPAGKRRSSGRGHRRK
ncbi:hypothetical protein F8568_042420 [Actinomadura sp. LD22]|uniref:Fibronectin type-III domain-containing protein n=1 Tax=Actinomadura physcomitrii TaxID=2650748 RepID=A0A6I4MSR1_9ACTN|nr:hypothetical protein [Actinomadura physcomitrii]MWA06887.1 hypothetical protein [Actinomadura physcomitrii]